MTPSFDWGNRLPTLSAPRVVLRWLGKRDVPALHEIFSDPEVMRYWSSPPLADLTAAADLLRDIRDLFRRRTLFQWGIALRQGDRVVGTCTLFHVEKSHRRAEIGYALGRAHWGQRLSTEAVTTLIAFAFDQLGLHRLEADVDPRNERSIRILVGQGFRREGHLRERYHVGGTTQDGLFYGLLRHEWRHAPNGEG